MFIPNQTKATAYTLAYTLQKTRKILALTQGRILTTPVQCVIREMPLIILQITLVVLNLGLKIYLPTITTV